MMMTSAELSFAAFVACNTMRVAAYFPQMAQIVRRPAAAAAISYPTWILFCVANVSTAVYAAVALGDPVLTAINGFNSTACATIIALAQWRQRTPMGASGGIGRP